MAVPRADQCVAVGETAGAEDRVSKGLGTMAALAWFAEERNFVLPHNLPGSIILAYGAVTFVSDEVIAIGDFADETRIAVRIRIVHLQFQLAMNSPHRVHFDDSSNAGLGDHCQSIIKALKGMHLDALAIVSI